MNKSCRDSCVGRWMSTRLSHLDTAGNLGASWAQRVDEGVANLLQTDENKSNRIAWYTEKLRCHHRLLCLYPTAVKKIVRNTLTNDDMWAAKASPPNSSGVFCSPQVRT